MGGVQGWLGVASAASSSSKIIKETHQEQMMAQRPIREYDGKQLLARWFASHHNKPLSEQRILQIHPQVDLENLPEQYPWLTTTSLVVKPDQLIKRRGQSGMLLLNANWPTARNWIKERMGKTIEVEHVRGVVDHFLIEPFIPHTPSDEYYLAIRTLSACDEILFDPHGGITVGDVDANAASLRIPVGEMPTTVQIVEQLLGSVHLEKKEALAGFINTLYACFVELHFTYLEINPLVMLETHLFPLDIAAKLDSTATFEPGARWWSTMAFPPAFGRQPTSEEAYIEALDRRSGSSLKLTMLNPAGRIWTLVAGGGASVMMADTICAQGYAHELANYGEYSGDPSEELTFAYTRTILDLMTRTPHPAGKMLLISGGIANFTDVAATFKGIVRALRDYQAELREQNVRIFVRRGGPNYQEGLMIMRDLGRSLNIPIAVYGPETHLTAIVGLALQEVQL
jgi:ATP citrate (pro-S)-lyase